jgi:hypothetical protein
MTRLDIRDLVVGLSNHGQSVCPLRQSPFDKLRAW